MLLLFLGSKITNSQSLTREETKEFFKTTPMFSTHKDNYLITGVPLNEDIDGETADIKYQISFKQMITRTSLPLNTYLFFTYSQKSFWNIYKKSSPFKDINFNPSIGLGKPIFNKQERLVGMASLEFVHNSNGQDSIYSRSWNRIILKYSTMLDEKTLFSGQIWIPLGYKDDNPDILDYEGLLKLQFEREFIPHKLSSEISFQKGLKWDWKGKFRARLYYNPFKNHHQYFMLEWFIGYNEDLLNYKHFSNSVRVGYVIKTDELNLLRKKSKED